MLSKKEENEIGKCANTRRPLTKINWIGVNAMAKKLFTRTVLVLKVILLFLVIDAFCVSWCDIRRATERYITAQSDRAAQYCVAHLGYEAAIKKVSPEEIREIVTEEAIAADLNPGLVMANLKIESSGDQFAVSKTGAIGLGQVMPANLKRCGYTVQQGFEARPNLKCAIRVLKEAHQAQSWNSSKALQEYNGGSKCVGKCAESINHSRKVLAELDKNNRRRG